MEENEIYVDDFSDESFAEVERKQKERQEEIDREIDLLLSLL